MRNGLLESCNMSIRLEYEIFCFCFFIYWHIFIYFYRFQVWLEGQIFLVLCFLSSHFYFMWNVVLLVSINLKCQHNLFWDCVAYNKANLMIGWSLFTMYSVSSLNGVNLIIVLQILREKLSVQGYSVLTLYPKRDQLLISPLISIVESLF